MDISKIWQYDLRKGSTDHPANGACLFDAGMWMVYGKIGDKPPCACPIIRSYAIGLNDTMNDKTRQLLKPFILRVVGNRDPEAEAARLHYIVLETARRVVPLASDLPQFAALRDLSDSASYKEIHSAAYDAARAAVDAYAAAHAAARAAAVDAAAAASRAAAAAHAAARAAYDAAHAAADAAAAASRAAAAVWQEASNILDGALRIGKQSPEFDEAAVRASVSAFTKARESINAR